MIVVVLLLLYPAIARGFGPLLLVPIAFSILLVSIYPDIMLDPAKSVDSSGRLLHYFYQLDEWGVLPPFIFMGVGAMADFGPLTTNPISLLLGAAAQFGTYTVYLLTALLGFNDKAAATIPIIGGANGPTPIFLANKMEQSEYLGAIAVTTYSHVSPVPIIQPPVMCPLTTEKERKACMAQLRPVPKLGKILFPVVVTVTVSLLSPTTTPLVGIPMFDNLLRELGVVRQLTDTAGNALTYTVVTLLGTSVGAMTSIEASLKADTLKIVFLGLVAFAFGATTGVLLDKLMYKLTGGKVSPLIGSAGVSAVPMSACVSQEAGTETGPTNFLLMHAMGPDVTGIIGTTVAAGAFMAIFGVR